MRDLFLIRLAKWYTAASLVAVLATSGGSCEPRDTRPGPVEVDVTASAPSAVIVR